MKHFDDTFKKFKSDLKSYYEDEIAGAIKAGNETYEGYKDQHEQFAVHVQTTLQQQVNLIFQYGFETDKYPLDYNRFSCHTKK